MIALEKSIRIAGIVGDSIVDGPGLRMTVFIQGCLRCCPGCHNPESWRVNGGREAKTDDLLAEVDKNPLLTGITLSGGEPLLRAGALLPFAEEVASRGLDLAVYTGWTIEEIISDGDKDVLALFGFASTLVDGPFVAEKKSLKLPFRGSANQRILDAKRSLLTGRAVLSDDPAWGV